MRHFIRFVWVEHRVISIVTVAALGIALFSLGDFAAKALHFSDPKNQNRPIEPWMSIRYVEESWGLTKPIMFDIIGYDVDTPPKKVPKSVGKYLDESGVSLGEFQAQVRDAKAMLLERRGK